MAKTIDEENYQKAAAFVTKQVEPRIKKLVDLVNEHFAKEGIRAGVEVKWFFDQIEVKKEETNVKVKSSS